MADSGTLLEIGLRHGSDKWSGHHYSAPYESHFGPMRQRKLDMLEIGIGGYEDPVAGGASLRAWNDYFPNATIVGLDFHDKTPHAAGRIKVYQGSQADPIAIARVLADFPEGFDIIIDDGSHKNEHIITSLLMLWQYVKPGGLYVIEDTQTSYWPNHGGLVSEKNSPLTSMGYLKSLVDCLNWQEIHQPTYVPSVFDLTLTGLFFYHNLVFLQKGSNTEGSTEVYNNRITGV